MSKEPNKRNTIYITHSIEFLFWVIVIFVLVLIFSIFHIKHQKDDNDYNIFMQDVDGLIVGSPVRIMGIEVGHITEIKPVVSEVFVKFIINDKSIVLPQGTIATVEFTGMAGSKSLELYMPDNAISKELQTPIITVNPPKRLHDALGLLNEMFDKIGKITYTTSSFGDKLKTIDIKAKNNNKNIKEFLDYADNLVDESNDKVEEFGFTIEKYSEFLKEKKHHGKVQP